MDTTSLPLHQQMMFFITNSPEEQAALSLCDFPYIELLEQAETKDQQAYWDQLRAFYIIVSLCWRCRLLSPSAELESLNDPLYPLLEAKVIDKIHYESVWRRVDSLQALYKVLEVGEKYVAEVVRDLGFAYPYTLSSLFYSIVRNDANNLFNVCLDPYKNIQTSNILTAAKLTFHLSKLQGLKPEEIRKIKYLGSQLQQNYLRGIAILACVQKIPADERLKPLLLKYTDAIGQEAKVTKTAMSRTRDSKTYSKPRSFVWWNGERVYGSRYGGTYSK